MTFPPYLQLKWGECVTGLNTCRAEIIRHISSGSISGDVLTALEDGDGLVPHETELWDYKQSVGFEKAHLAELARDIISFHNSYGGYILIGVDDDGQQNLNDDLSQNGAELDSQQVRALVKTYSGSDIGLALSLISWRERSITLIYIPKRGIEQSPCTICRQGPEIGKGKVIFKPGDIFFRSEDSSQLIRGPEDLRFLIGARRHPEETRSSRESRVVSNNLPDRGAIFSKFFGRGDVKELLWSWLADPFSKYRVVAGAGGIGKTSAVYSFCEEVCAESPLDFEQVVWLSAKQKQFLGIDNRVTALPYQEGSREYGQSYRDFESMLDALSFHLAVSDSEWDGCGVQEKKRLLSQSLSLIRSLVVIDDLDSLAPDDQRTAVEFAMSLATGESRIIFTTRKNYLAPAASTIELRGLDDEAFSEYVAHLQVLHARKLSASEVRDIKGVTDGSPLFVESIFRLLRLGERFGEAIQRWKGRDGESVRAACFQREVGQLTFSAKRALFALCQFDSAALSELKQVAEMQTHDAELAIQELHGLFLIQSREIAGEARFSVPVGLKLMLDDVKDQVPDWKEIARRSKVLRMEAKSGVGRDRDREVAMAIQQAMAQLGAGTPEQAARTLASVIASNSKSADLHMVYARCLSRCEKPDVARTRRAFQTSFDLGKKEPQLFIKWLEFEVDLGNANAAIDVIRKASLVMKDDDWRWLDLRSRAYSKRGRERELRREWTDSLTDWVAASKCIVKALRLAPAAAKPGLRSHSQLINDALWRVSASGQASLPERFRIGLDAIRKGDRRDLCVHRLLDLIDLAAVSNQAVGRGPDEIYQWIRDVEELAKGRPSGRLNERIRAFKKKERGQV